ncbi:MAG: DUF5659 domain-containing protein [Clostridiales bacterium]|nr:DUF5659 domain-containing protein [Clostridiales bacterium]
MRNKYIPVFSKRLAERLFSAGYVIDHTDVNRNNNEWKVFYFRESPKVRAAVEAYRTEVRNGKHQERV